MIALHTIDYLPATAPEIAAAMGRTAHQVQGSLCALLKRGKVVRTDRVVVSNDPRRGRKQSRIWERVK